MKKRFCIFIVFLVFVLSCKNKRYEFYPDGKIKIEFEIYEGKRNGVAQEYYPTGVLRLKQNWKNGLLDGPVEEFYPDGSISKKGFLKDDKFTDLVFYYRSGGLASQYYFNKNGDILDIHEFKEDGTRDSAAFPFFHFVSYGDTIKVGRESTLRALIVNVTDSLYRHGQMIVCSSFDTISNRIILKDTLKIVNSKNGFEYIYELTPKRTGGHRINGQFVFKKNIGDEILVDIMRFSYPYFVIEAEPRPQRFRHRIAKN